MIAVIDVQYSDTFTQTGLVVAKTTFDPLPHSEGLIRGGPAAPYEPGAFYKRELPCLLAALGEDPFDIVIIDGYVDLGAGVPGLGRHLHRARGGMVIGVAKTRYVGADHAWPVLRGKSESPLYVTATGMSELRAAEIVRDMAGAHRIPTLIKRADQLARRGA